jgi:hypothetical protein
MRRTRQIGLRLTEKEFSRLERAAATEEVTPQAYVRALVMRMAGSSGQTTRVIREILDDLLRDHSHADRIYAIRHGQVSWRIVVELGRSAGWTTRRIRDEFFSAQEDTRSNPLVRRRRRA